MRIASNDLEDALLWLARSGGRLTFDSVGMASGVPSHANAGYVVEAALPGEGGAATRAFVGSYEARTAGLSASVVRVVAELRADAASTTRLTTNPSLDRRRAA